MSQLKSSIEEMSPDWLFWIIRSTYSIVAPEKETSIVVPEDDIWKVIGTNGDRYYTSSPKRSNWLQTFEHDIVQKYTLDGFVELERGDVVFDIGAFVGAFSIRAAEISERVIAIEPSPKNRKALNKNLKHHDNVDVVSTVAWKERTKIELEIAKDPTDNSVLGADDGSTGQNITLTAETLDDIAATHDVDVVDFLKLDAEGAEPEVLQGVDTLKVQKMAIDCSPEREGQPTFDEISELLKGEGYDIRTQGQVLFARRD